MATVYLHVGAFKSGTSFLQSVLMESREALADQGILWPGRDWRAVVHGVQGLRNRRKIPYERWTDLVGEIDRWEGKAAIISMEFLSLLTDDQVAQCIESLGRHHVRVVLTVRDLGRQIPAQWQESVQHSGTWSYHDYLGGLMVADPMSDPRGKHFWAKQDYPAILRPWAKRLPPEDLIVVTVPPSGAPRGLLWERFASAVGIRPDSVESAVRANESLGATSAEVMRHVSMAWEGKKLSDAMQRTLKYTVAKGVMASRKSDEPILILPPEYREWTTERSHLLISELQALSPVVVGDLQDLVPVYAQEGPNTTTNPSEIPTDELLSAAAHGIVGLAEQLTEGTTAKGRADGGDGRVGGRKGRRRRRS